MLSIFILFFLAAILLTSLTTVPFYIAVLFVGAVIFRRSRVFFLALGLGLFLDLIMIRPLGYTSLALTIFVFLIRLYERKFETQTLAFVFLATFLGSLSYLWIFGYNQVLMQAFVNALVAILLFVVIPNLFRNLHKDRS